MKEEMMELFFVDSADIELASLPRSVRDKFSTDIQLIRTRAAPLSKTKRIEGLGSSVNKPVLELIKNGRPAYRCVYVVKGGALYILHAFSKTSDDLPKENLQVIKRRYKEIP